MTAHPPEKIIKPSQFLDVRLLKPIDPESLVYYTTDPTKLALTSNEKRLLVLDKFTKFVEDELRERQIAFTTDEGDLIVTDPNQSGTFGGIVKALADMLKIKPPEEEAKIPG